MRTLSRMSAELSNLELGLDLELNSDDVAAAEAAVAAHGESLICSCCDVELTDKDSLHLHQISQHSISQLSIALLSLRGLDVSSGLVTEVQQDLCCQDSDSESTVSAHSSFMFGFAEEFSNTCRQNEVSVCAASGQNMSAPGSYICETPSSLPNAPQYASEFPGSMSFSENNADMSCYGVDIHRNHQRADDLPLKMGFSGTDFRQSMPHNSFLPNTNGAPKASGGGGHDQTGSFHQGQDAFTQLNKNPEGRKKCGQPSKTASRESAAISTTPKTNIMTCARKAVADVAKPAGKEADGREFRCEICGRKYKRKSHLGRHIRMHSGIRPFPCTLCDKRFAVRSILKQHMRVHTGERPFNCPFCLQRFPQKSGLVTHMMLHTGKPYKCDLCDKSFVSKHKLSVHKKAHEEQSGRWPAMGPYSCPTCSTRFFTSSALAEHAKVHIVGVHETGSGAAVVESTPSSESCATPTAEKLVTHNSQEVTAGQALLTLMDSDGVQGDPGLRVRRPAPSDASDSDSSEVPLHFEFCDVPLDLKSSIYLKEECFDFQDAPRNDIESKDTGSSSALRSRETSGS